MKYFEVLNYTINGCLGEKSVNTYGMRGSIYKKQMKVTGPAPCIKSNQTFL